MKETPEQIAQRIQDARGYIVVCSRVDRPIGYVFGPASISDQDPSVRLKCELVIIAKTDIADFEAQHAFNGRPFGIVPHSYFFRVRAE